MKLCISSGLTLRRAVSHQKGAIEERSKPTRSPGDEMVMESASYILSLRTVSQSRGSRRLVSRKEKGAAKWMR